MFKILLISLLLTSLLFFAGCSKDKDKFEIDKIEAYTRKLGLCERANIKAFVDGDAIFDWSCSGGNFQVQSQVNLVCWLPPEIESECYIEVTATDGDKEDTAGIMMEVIGLYYDDFTSGDCKWDYILADKDIEGTRVYITGTEDGYFGIMNAMVNPKILSPYEIKTYIGRSSDFDPDRLYGLVFSVDDTGDPEITHFAFWIYPNEVDLVWGAFCFVDSNDPGWYLLEEDSYGPLDPNIIALDVVQEVEWKFDEFKNISIMLNGNQLYFSNVVSILEVNWNDEVDVNVNELYFFTTYDAEMFIDEILVTRDSLNAKSDYFSNPEELQKHNIDKIFKFSSQKPSLTDSVK